MSFEEDFSYFTKRLEFESWDELLNWDETHRGYDKEKIQEHISTCCLDKEKILLTMINCCTKNGMIPFKELQTALCLDVSVDTSSEINNRLKRLEQ